MGMIVGSAFRRRLRRIRRGFVQLSSRCIAMAVVLAPAPTSNQTIGRTGTVTQYIQLLVRVVVYIDDTFLRFSA